MYIYFYVLLKIFLFFVVVVIVLHSFFVSTKNMHSYFLFFVLTLTWKHIIKFGKKKHLCMRYIHIQSVALLNLKLR